jgi:hypothetical protein
VFTSSCVHLLVILSSSSSCVCHSSLPTPIPFLVINCILLSALFGGCISNTRGIPRALEAKHEKNGTRISIMMGIHTALPSMSGSSKQTRYAVYPFRHIRERLCSPAFNTKNELNERVVHSRIMISV